MSELRYRAEKELTEDERKRLMRERIWGGDASELVITPKGQTPPPVGPVKASQWAWDAELSKQLGERQ